MKGSPLIKVLIADDHIMVRKGLKQIIEETPDIVVAGEAGNGREVMARIKANDYDVVVLDITMPGGNGLETLKQLKVEKPNLPILMLSMHPEELYAVRALRTGASGYLSKESAPDELIKAIRKISKGKKYLSPHLSRKLSSNTGHA